jgi:hypothetical protein
MLFFFKSSAEKRLVADQGDLVNELDVASRVDIIAINHLWHCTDNAERGEGGVFEQDGHRSLFLDNVFRKPDLLLFLTNMGASCE